MAIILMKLYVFTTTIMTAIIIRINGETGNYSHTMIRITSAVCESYRYRVSCTRRCYCRGTRVLKELGVRIRTQTHGHTQAHIQFLIGSDSGRSPENVVETHKVD